ncbi:glycosyltransferase family 2 protein [Methanobacterium alcaliphilum]|uniref:glycosyltransferase family 2 protein n=1 Tax=Methanobacterium alcaliphilum TaxID=392018 RepID=UPI00200AB028|nr:glycosyltransferase [Methanobacterium alcaliphilum]MCK9152240.1 glycosyltransferase [Methanobacterium alcaliphilum]
MNKDKILVSIIIPVFNTEDYLEECLDSLINQTLKNIEIICINDGSTDNSLNILKDYAARDNRIKIIDKKNEGQSVARNRGVKEAKGEYIAFVDSDDYINLNAYELLYDFAKKHDHDMVLCDVIRFNSEKTWRAKLHRISIPVDEVIVSTNILERPTLIYDTGPWNKLIKKSFWDENKFSFLDGYLYEDLLISAEMHCAAKSVGICPQTRYYWRFREGENISTTQNTLRIKNLQDRVFIINKLSDLYKSKPEYNSLLLPHYKKCMEYDLMIFLDKVNMASEEYLKELIRQITPLVDEIGLGKDINLRVWDKFKYQLIKDNDVETLKKVTTYTQKYNKKGRIMRSACMLANALKDNILMKLWKFRQANKAV